MPSLASIIEEIELSSSTDNDINNSDFYNQVFDYYTSSNVTDDYEQAVRQLDTTLLSHSDQCLLFDIFHMATEQAYYDNQQRDKFCNFWLPIYESMFKQLLPEETSGVEEDIDHSRLVVIKYLVANMIEMQKTFESMSHFLKEETQFQNFTQKDQYLAIIKLILPLLTNRYVIERLHKDDQNNIKLEWQPNDMTNIIDVTGTLVIWLILKLIVMFIKTDGDCLTVAKHDKDIKNVLLTSMEQVNDNNPIKLSLYVTAALLMNEQDIKNEIKDPIQIITTLITNIKQIVDSEKEDAEFSINGVHIQDMMIALKAYLQHDQVKNGFIVNDGLELLVDMATEATEDASVDFNDDDFAFDEEEKRQIESDPELRKTMEQNKSHFKNDIIEMTKEMELLAFECLFVMSFNEKAADLLKKNEEFMSQIRKLADENNTRTTSISEPLKKAVDGLLWKLEKEDQFKKEQPTNEKNDDFDLMISYSWSDKLLVHNIYKYLTEEYNFKIWLDENQMSGSLCQAMAQAVDKSKFILMCMSETYKGSENCRNEAEYARDRKKPIIPLVMKKVERDGWLGFISAGKMYIDFAKQDFEKAAQLLIAEIQRNQQTKEVLKPKEKSSPTTAPVSQAISTSIPLSNKLPVRPNVISNAYKTIPMKLWSDQHVQDFLYDNKLDMMILLTEYMNGEELNILLDKCLPQQDYWIMFDRLSKEMEKRHQQTLPLSVYLRFLNQTDKYLNESFF